MTLEFDTCAAQDLSALRSSVAGQAKFNRYLTLLVPQPGEHILDLGCGSGEFSRLLAQHVGPDGRTTAVDPSADSLRLARSLSANPSAGASDEASSGIITYEQGDGHALGHAPATFDAAACISVLTFCQSPQDVVRELHRVLRPGGRLLLANTDEDSRFYNSQNRELGRRIQRAIADRGLEPWSGRRLAYWLEKAGFDILAEDIRVELEHQFAAGKSGYVLAHSMRDYLINQAGISRAEYGQWLEELQIAENEGSYSYGAMSYRYLATK